MSDRRAIRNAAGIYVALWLAGIAAVPSLPCEYQNAAVAQEPPADDHSNVRVASDVKPEVIIAERFEPGEPIEASVDFEPPAGVIFEVEFETPLKFRSKPGAARAIYLWTPGSGTWPLRMNWVLVLDGKATFGHSDAKVVVGDPEPPKPLSELIAGETAAKLAALYRAMAVVPPPDDFWAAHASLVEERGIVLSADALKALHARLDALVADAPALQAELAKIAGELGEDPAPPPTPPVVEGKRRIVILHESGDDDPAQARLYVQLRGSAVAPYLASKGHKLDILDATDNPLANGLTLPAMLILDASTGAKIATLPLPASTAAFLEAVKSNGG
jgi:hypothetical protein